MKIRASTVVMLTTLVSIVLYTLTSFYSPASSSSTSFISPAQLLLLASNKNKNTTTTTSVKKNVTYDGTIGGWLQSTFAKFVETHESDIDETTEDYARRKRYNSMTLTPENLVLKVNVWKAAPTDSSLYPKIIGITHTYKPKHANAQDMYDTWGRKLHKHFIYTNAVEPPVKMESGKGYLVDLTPLPGGFGYNNIWNKVRHIWKDLHKRGELAFGAADFYFIAGDDVLLVTENLKKYLMRPEVVEAHKARMPLVMGHRMTEPTGRHFLSGAGYIVNDVAARLFMENIENPVCNPTVETFAEDVFFCDCLNKLGSPPRDTMDYFGEDRIAIVSPYHLAQQTNNQAYMWWYAPWHRFRGRPMPTGNDAISIDAFLFHYMAGVDLKTTWKIIYRENSR
eukprot:PhF_6_TR13214/c0_g1_i2/m.20891/K00731/C1GALT1; glycoprotein-N-acetylgalactosamine 3-beta-galactosyltransferase